MQVFDGSFAVVTVMATILNLEEKMVFLWWLAQNSLKLRQVFGLLFFFFFKIFFYSRTLKRVCLISGFGPIFNLNL